MGVLGDPKADVDAAVDRGDIDRVSFEDSNVEIPDTSDTSDSAEERPKCANLRCAQRQRRAPMHDLGRYRETAWSSAVKDEAVSRASSTELLFTAFYHLSTTCLLLF